MLLALVVVLPNGLLALGGGFDGLYGQDAFAYFDYATGPLRQSLLDHAPPPPFFWPPGYPLLVAILSLILGPVPLAGQIVSLLAGGLVPLFTALLAREVWAEPSQSAAAPPAGWLSGPLLAGLLAGLCGQLWQSSAVVMADTTGLAAATLGAWALARYGRGARPVWLTIAAAALSWAILTRWIYGLVAVPFGVYALLALRRRGGRAALVEAGAAGLVAGLVLAPVLVPAVAGLVTAPGELAPFAGNVQVYWWSPLNLWRNAFETADGHLQYRLPNGLYYAAAPAHWFFFTPILGPLILPGLWVVARRRSASALLLVVGWSAVVYLFHAGAPWQNFRFTLAYLPPTAMLVAMGLQYVRASVGPRGGRLLSLGLAAGLALMASSGVYLTRSFIERKQDDLAIVRWVEAQAPPGGRLLTFSLTSTFRHYSRLETHELFELDPSTLGEAAPTLLLVDVPSIQTQWRDRSPGKNYAWLRDGPGLVEVGQRGPYTLFRVGVPRR